MANVPLPSDINDPLILADWMEILALAVDDGNASHGDLQRALNRLGVDNLDSICTDSMRELHRRVEATGESYPFTFSGSLLQKKSDWHDYIPYVFCLLLSYCDDKKKKVKGIKHEVLFEQLSCIAAKNYINGEVLRFGAPREELPSGFIDALKVLCGKIKEWTPVAHKTLRKKDGGLDLVAWKHFPDQQIGKLILFGHCASGENWDDKINELQPNDFCSLWLGGDKSPIVKTFFIPHRLAPERFTNRAVSAKLFFDRCRIAYWVSNGDFRSMAGDAILVWCRTVLAKVTA